MTIKDLVWVEDVGKEKPRYHNVGILMEKDDGKVSIKLNVTPVGNWNGWLSVFTKKDKPSIPTKDVNSDIEPF